MRPSAGSAGARSRQRLRAPCCLPSNRVRENRAPNAVPPMRRSGPAERVQESRSAPTTRAKLRADSEERSDPRAESCADDKRVPVDRVLHPASRERSVADRAASTTAAVALRTTRPPATEACRASNAAAGWAMRPGRGPKRESRDRKDGDSDRAAMRGRAGNPDASWNPSSDLQRCVAMACRSHTCRRPAQLPPKARFAERGAE